MSDEEPRRADLVQYRRALREEWPMAPATRLRALREVGKIMKTAKSPRTRLMAAKTLMAAGLLNLRQGDLDLAREKFAVDRDGDESTPSARDVVEDMAAAAERYEREHPDDEAGEDPGGVGEVSGEAEPV